MRSCKNLRHACAQGQPAGGARYLSESSSCRSGPCWSEHSSNAGLDLLRLLLSMLWLQWLLHLPRLQLLLLRRRRRQRRHLLLKLLWLQLLLMQQQLLLPLLLLLLRLRVHCPLGASIVQNGLQRSVDIVACCRLLTNCLCGTPLVVSQPATQTGHTAATTSSSQGVWWLVVHRCIRRHLQKGTQLASWHDGQPSS
jgi:hypothetical protein